MLKQYWDFDMMYAQPCALVLGGFDGLHLGHRALLKAATQNGLPVVLTSILGGKGGVLFTEEERTHIFEQAGVDCVVYIPFTQELKNMPADDFLDELFTYIEVAEIYCGCDFRFGKDRLGTPEFLDEQSLSRPVHILPLLEKHGEKVAVSKIKNSLFAGTMSEVSALLGSDYFVQGVVEHGREVGRTYGFPTLNVSVPSEKLLPKEGVYGGYAETPAGTYKTIINIGARPTFGVEEKKIEAYLDGFSGDLYGATVRIYPTQFYREIEKFSSADELKEQLKKDIKRLRL